MCVDWIYIYCCMLFKFVIFKFEMMIWHKLVNWKWILIMWLLCELIIENLLWNWLNLCCCWEWYEYDICWVEDWDIELLMIKDWFKLLWLWIGIVDMDWDDELCELFVLWMVMS